MAQESEATFGQAMTELESIVRQLEAGQVDLEKSLAQYERGVALITELRQKLEDAEQKVTTLLGDVEPSLDDDGEAE